METSTLLKLILASAYLLLLLYTIIRILLDTGSTSKTLAYLLLVIVFPVGGIAIYFSFGVNYRHRRITKRGRTSFDQITEEYNSLGLDNVEDILANSTDIFHQYGELARFVDQIGQGERIGTNDIELLINGEEKFPEVLSSLEQAEHFIHLEYYDWENDTRGNQIKDVLLKKHREGVKVRIMYDDFASKGIKRNIVRELKSAGIEIYPVIRIRFRQLANRLNHRDHRKVIIIDGETGFVGGINISDRYDNGIDTGLFWRDTHIKITGSSVISLLRHWIINWNTCQDKPLAVNTELVPNLQQILSQSAHKKYFAQIVAGGPVYRMSNIMLTYERIFTLASKKIYITNPYFIPSESIMNALKVAAISGVDVRLMLPKVSDSWVVGAASKFYYEDLLAAGVKIYEYRKGFVHAKTVVADARCSIVGTANMDVRSFDLNFEIFSVIYDPGFSQALEDQYLIDVKECDEVNYQEWLKQGQLSMLSYSLARLSSSFL